MTPEDRTKGQRSSEGEDESEQNAPEDHGTDHPDDREDSEGGTREGDDTHHPDDRDDPERGSDAHDESDLPERTSTQPAAASPLPTNCDSLLLSFLVFCLICFGVWVVGAVEDYREEYAQATEGWRVGTTRSVEITLVKSDKADLGCASNKDFWGLRCGGAESSPSGPEPQILQPYNTVNNQLFLGAGLWSSLGKTSESLPMGRFTVICNYHIKGVVRSPSIRFSSKAPFQRLKRTATVGTLSDCMIPR